MSHGVITGSYNMVLLNLHDALSNVITTVVIKCDMRLHGVLLGVTSMWCY